MQKTFTHHKAQKVAKISRISLNTLITSVSFSFRRTPMIPIQEEMVILSHPTSQGMTARVTAPPDQTIANTAYTASKTRPRVGLDRERRVVDLSSWIASLVRKKTQWVDSDAQNDLTHVALNRRERQSLPVATPSQDCVLTSLSTAPSVPVRKHSALREKNRCLCLNIIIWWFLTM